MKHKALIFSITLNLFLIAVVCIEETQGHVIGLALERRGFITLDAKSHPDFWARASWNSCIEKMGQEYDVAFFGNSITRGGDFQNYFPEKKIINLGLAGDNLIGMIQRVKVLKASKPKKVFIMAGTNDLHHLSLDKFKERYTMLVSEVKKELPGSVLYCQSVLPMNHQLKPDAPSDEKIREANAIINNVSNSWGRLSENLM